MQLDDYTFMRIYELANTLDRIRNLFCGPLPRHMHPYSESLKSDTPFPLHM